ncbi:MAG: SelB C-terminal domain-containing protein [Candidatus Sericytochromatia bacterium]
MRRGQCDRLGDHFGANRPFTTSEARELLGTSRKYVIPLLEYLDSQGVTRRVGDTRVVVERPATGGAPRVD